MYDCYILKNSNPGLNLELSSRYQEGKDHIQARVAMEKEQLMRDPGLWDSALQGGDFLPKLFLSFVLEFSVGMCVGLRDSAFRDKEAPVYTNNVVIKSSKASLI